MLATLVNEPLEGKEWIYEMKWDGYRALGFMNKGKVQIWSRNNKSFSEKFYPLYQALQGWKVNAVVDGEIVVLDKNGLPNFSALQQWRSEEDGQLIYYLFDLLWLDGINVMGLALEERRTLLYLLTPTGPSLVRLSASLKNGGKEAFKQAEALHLEGVMAKKKGSAYISNARSMDWLKIKTEKRQELIIGGYTKNEGSKKKISALLMGIIEKGSFQFITPVGTGFSLKMQEEIIKKAQPYKSQTCPFAKVPEFNKPSRFRPHPPKATVTWIRPKLVAEISYRETTDKGAFRQPSFKGLREDKTPLEVKREISVASEQLIKSHKFVKEKIISAPLKKERKTLINPKEETQTRNISGHELRFTNLNKIFWPKEKYTKGNLINYYYQVAPFILPYLKDRPQTLNRYPNGIASNSFYQKDVKGKIPQWMETFPYYSQRDQKEKEFIVCTGEASLLYLAGLGCIELNPWHSRRQKPDKPDWCIIDLDPDKNTFNQVILAAQVTKKILDAIGVPSYCKTSGATGLHIYIPFGAIYSFEDAREFGRRIVKIIHEELPDFTSIERKTSERNGNMYLDFLQNRPQATVAAPYSLRPKAGATVSMPLHWDEVKKGLKIKDFNILNTLDRLKTTGDLFKGVLGKGIDLNKANKNLDVMFHSKNEQ
ncbi:MAG: hypothetical protein NVS1B13_11240 [Flavisolibacter sp.]